jgi:hypothetical protein
LCVGSGLLFAKVFVPDLDCQVRFHDVVGPRAIFGSDVIELRM